jgi:hypothetical protein
MQTQNTRRPAGNPLQEFYSIIYNLRSDNDKAAILHAVLTEFEDLKAANPDSNDWDEVLDDATKVLDYVNETQARRLAQAASVVDRIEIWEKQQEQQQRPAPTPVTVRPPTNHHYNSRQ